MGDDMAKLLASFNNQMSSISKHSPASRGTCEVCGKEIFGDLFTANAKLYHPEHFNCDMCKSSLGSTYYEHLNGVFCKNCFEKKVCDQCVKCNLAIMDSMVEVGNKKYHGDCFRCTHCNVSLDGAPFLERDGDPFCEAHYHSSFAPRCKICKQPIPGEGVLAFESQYHFECFRCASCNNVLEGGKFWEFAGEAFCEPHYHTKKGNVCADCGGAIPGGSRCVTALGKKFHPDHFRCSGCSKGLNGLSFAEVEGKAYCEPCDLKLFP